MITLPGGWLLSSSSDPRALAVVDGIGPWKQYGPHYSRRTPGSRTFTGVGREVVLVHESGAAVWAVVLQKTPARRGTGCSRGRSGAEDRAVRWIWRNVVFRRLPECEVLASDLIRSATVATYMAWVDRYGCLPECRLRTEIGIKQVRSTNPGYCYQVAGYAKDRVVRGKLYMFAPPPTTEQSSQKTDV